MTDTVTNTPGPAVDPGRICVACVGDGTNPAGGICLRCRGTRIDPDPAAPSGIPVAS